MNFPLISIVTPTFNQENFLEQAIRSVLSQDYPNIEYIVINDGSTDGTTSILRRYEKKIRIISQKNRGQSATLNTGWKLCNGEYLGYLSSDDLLDRNAISIMAEKLFNDSSVDCVYPNYRLIDSRGRCICEIDSGEFDSNKMINDVNCLPGPGALFRKNVFLELGGWSESLSYVADYDFWLRLNKIGDFAKINRTLASFRIHQDSGLVKKISSEKSDEIISVIKKNVDSNNKLSLANAYVISAKNHLKSGRHLTFFMRVSAAIKIYPAIIKQKKTWKIFFSGLFRTPFYRFTKRI